MPERKAPEPPQFVHDPLPLVLRSPRAREIERNHGVPDRFRVQEHERHSFIREVEGDASVEEDRSDVGERIEHGFSDVDTQVQRHPGVSFRVRADVGEGEAGGVAEGEEIFVGGREDREGVNVELGVVCPAWEVVGEMKVGREVGGWFKETRSPGVGDVSDGGRDEEMKGLDLVEGEEGEDSRVRGSFGLQQ